MTTPLNTWISVKDAMPPTAERTPDNCWLVCQKINYDGFAIPFFAFVQNEKIYSMAGYEEHNTTHWQLLSKPKQ